MTAVHALYEQHILKTGRGNKDHPRALTLKKRVDPQGGAQHNRGGVFDLETGLAYASNPGNLRLQLADLASGAPSAAEGTTPMKKVSSELELLIER